MNISEHQAEQLAIATSARVGILTGSAGTGKSHTSAHFLRGLAPDTYLVAAPTGKAASRLNADLKCGARTVHTMLGTMRNGHDGDGWSFFFNADNPLECETLLVDEAFMLSTDTFADLLRAVPPTTRVLLVGDPNQLSPVGHGCPVFDMIRSGVVPHGHLSEVWRYAGRIARVANAIKDGEAWKPSEDLDLESQPPENYRHIECNTPMASMHLLPKLLERLFENRGFDPFEDVQVICWMNDKGALCRAKLNEQLQKILNPKGEKQDDIKFRLGDKIICTKNHWRTPLDPDGLPIEVDRLSGTSPDVYLANGEIGRVTGWAFTRSKGKAKKITGVLAEFNGQTVQIHKGPTGLDLFDPAYAVTCHKFQGAQSKVVIVVADDSADRVANRQGWYTGMTRAGQILLTIGRMSTIVRQCKTLDVTRRRTFLPELIREGANRHEPVFDDAELMEI